MIIQTREKIEWIKAQFVFTSAKEVKTAEEAEWLPWAALRVNELEKES